MKCYNVKRWHTEVIPLHTSACYEVCTDCNKNILFFLLYLQHNYFFTFYSLVIFSFCPLSHGYNRSVYQKHQPHGL